MSHKLSWVAPAPMTKGVGASLIAARPSRERWRHLFWRPPPKRSPSGFSMRQIRISFEGGSHGRFFWDKSWR